MGSPGLGSLIKSGLRAGCCLTWLLQSVQTPCRRCKQPPSRCALHSYAYDLLYVSKLLDKGSGPLGTLQSL